MTQDQCCGVYGRSWNIPENQQLVLYNLAHAMRFLQTT